MPHTPKIRSLTPPDWEAYKRLRLRSLADSPDAFGSTLEDERALSDAEWLDRLASGSDSRWNLPLAAEAGQEQVGLAWGRIAKTDPDVASLYQMWVAPSHRGLGVGRMLLEAVISWAIDRRALYLELEVACGDSPARRLYERLGFEPIGAPQPLRPGSDLLGQPMRLTLKNRAA